MRKKHGNIGWHKDLAAILIFLFLFPYFVFSFKEQREVWSNPQEVREEPADKEILRMYAELDELPHNARYFVVWEEDPALILPVEHFLVGALAASISADYEKEVMKAQAILLRSTLVRAYEEQREKSVEERESDTREELNVNKESWSYWTDQDMQKRWGIHYEEYLKKCLTAVKETQGIYLSYESHAINGFYTGMSAGGTRKASELSGEETYSYLKQTTCIENLSAVDYMKEYKVKKGEVGNLSDAEINPEGYVLSVIRDGKRVSGEELRKEHAFVSSNFTWEESGNYYIFRTKGKGHGFGLDQYYGNILAGKGKNQQEIIEYFFADVAYQRME